MRKRAASSFSIGAVCSATAIIEGTSPIASSIFGQ
jgi:hypothetical protein